MDRHNRTPKRAGLAGMLAGVAWALAAAPAGAAVEVWNQFSTEVELTGARGWRPHSLDFTTDVRYRSDLVGLERVQLRWGPRWDLEGPWSLGLNHTAYLQQPTPGAFIQEQRVEVEPQLRGALGPLTWRDRSRLEWRWRPDRTSLRYRNQLRLEGDMAPGWQPLAADEAFFDLGGAGFNENRVAVGLAREVAGAGWEVAYSYRVRYGAGAPPPDHLVTVGWFNAVHRAPLFSGPAGPGPWALSVAPPPARPPGWRSGDDLPGAE